MFRRTVVMKSWFLVAVLTAVVGCSGGGSAGHVGQAVVPVASVDGGEPAAPPVTELPGVVVASPATDPPPRDAPPSSDAPPSDAPPSSEVSPPSDARPSSDAPPTEAPPSSDAVPYSLVGSADGYLRDEAGAPFFWLADTAWGLPLNLDREEVEHYLDTRAAQGFNAVQMVLVFDYAGGPGPNAYGDHPYSGDLSRLLTTAGDDVSDADEYDYWDHVDFIVDAATARDMWVGVLPIWANGVSGNGMMVGDVLTAGNASAYGAFLGSRYAGRRVVWVLGGDRSPEGQQHLWRDLARGLASGVSGAEDHSSTTMTYHPGASQSSGEWLHDEPWLDFNMVQGGHCLRHDVRAELIESTRTRHPVKPFIDAEPIYEDHPYCWDEPPEGFSTALDVRRDAYWSAFAGAAGHTYGHHAVWQFLREGEAAELGARGDWRAALDSPGAVQMGHLEALMISRPFTTAIPDTTVVVSDVGTSTRRLQASRATDGSFLMVYSPDGAPFELNLGVLSGDVARLWWFDPRTGNSQLVEDTAADTASMIPPSTDDWVLVADDAARDFAPPGA